MARLAEEEPIATVQETQFADVTQQHDPINSLDTDQDTTDPSQNNQSTQYGSLEEGRGIAVTDSAVAAPASTRALAPDLLRGLLMILQSIDHSALFFGAWKHGVATGSEEDGAIARDWNAPTAWAARVLTHLCAPGFMFLLGMGVVYFGRSRNKLGWPTYRLLSHFAIRATILIVINIVWGIIVSRGQYFILNIVLFALAVNYFLTGLLWLSINASEELLSAATFHLLPKPSQEDDASQPLFSDRTRPGNDRGTRARSISWHLHNILLLVITIITIWWNIWLSPNHGHCSDVTSYAETGSLGPFFEFLFHFVRSERVMSAFPPLAWLSFSVLGLLYGRVALVRPWTKRQLSLANLAVAVGMLLLFVLTRILHVGNLSEDCLQMPEHASHPSRNQYLTSVRAFLYVVKYPPSPAFLALTMSVNFLLLAFFGAIPPATAARIPGLLIFGTSALFFYFAHLILYPLLAIPVKRWFGHDLGYPDMEGKPAVGTGDTPVYWISWLIGIAILYPMCVWYGRLKSTKGPNSIWRFF